jgi:hypothetical protein
MRHAASLLLALLCLGAAGCGRSAEQALADVEQAAVMGDVLAFRDQLSEPTLRFLREEFEQAKEEAAVAFMMDRLKTGMPRRVLNSERDGLTTILKVAGKRGTGTLKFRWSLGAWRLDLVDDYRAWQRFGETVRKMVHDMQLATPFLGLEGPGKKFLDVQEKE